MDPRDPRAALLAQAMQGPTSRVYSPLPAPVSTYAQDPMNAEAALRLPQNERQRVQLGDKKLMDLIRDFARYEMIRKASYNRLVPGEVPDATR